MSAWIRGSAALALALAMAVVATTGCSGGERLLAVDVKTDYVPGLEFAEVRNEMVLAEGLDSGLASRTTMQVAARRGQDYIEGQRTAEFDLDQPGDYVVTTSLHAADGAVVGKRTTRVTVKNKTRITVVISRSCEGVTCPGPDDPEDATVCGPGGECVSPTCTPETPDACGGSECSSDEDCASRVSCAEGRCIDSYCLQVPVEGECGEGEWCSVERGCLPLPDDADGGPGDGGTSCVPEAEVCNGADDDCDGTTDEDFDLDNDPDNCGSCGNVCGGDHATAVCSAGSCALECDDGWDDCDGDPSNGCEADLTQPGSCGSCGTVCSDPTPLCVDEGGTFACVSSCPDSAPTLCGGSCVDTDTSLNHCGGCDMPCDPPDGTGSCSGGSCSIASCDAGRDDCNGDVADGCEADLSSTDHCGACGNACGGSTPYCQPSDGSWACTDGCSDGVRTGDESDADCGGSYCGPCGSGDRCNGDGDCGGSLVCEGGVCSSCGECEPGATDTQACGDCGTQSRTCTSTCVWGSWGACTDEGVCTPGSTDTEACGDCGERSRSCNSSCAWGSWSSCSGEGVCSPGATDTQACGNCGTQSRTCSSSCVWGGWDTCSGEGVCSPSSTRTVSCGDCGTRTDTCTSSCTWSTGSCTGQGPCSPGETRTASCGNCGTRTDTCSSSCSWQTGTCTGEGPCSPGQETSSGCDNSCQVKTCTSSCSWPSGACDDCGSCSSDWQCGYSCSNSTTHHVEQSDSNRFSCDSGPAVYCVPNCGTGFWACGYGCPGGYHVEQTDDNRFSCESGPARYCVIDDGSFWACGYSCPSGWHSTSSDSNRFSCGSGPAVYCQPD